VDRTADALIGRVLDGRYRVGPKIARGGMATVYEAIDLRLDRTVAVKVMHEGLTDDDEFVRRFQREARSAARLAHQNVVAVFDTGDDDGTLFLVMEYVPGLTLRDLIRKEAPMSPAKALAVIEPVLSALAAAHTAGILHRDVKPENVLLADDGRVKVADFGLARAINSDTQHTATGGVLIGTVSYLSPELVVNGHADARADVHGRARDAAAGQLGRDAGGHAAGAIAELERAACAVPHQEHLVDLQPVHEIPHQHGRNARAASGRQPP